MPLFNRPFFFIPTLLWMMAQSAGAQIELASYPKQFSCDIDGIEHIEAPEARSSCGAVQMEFADQRFSGGCLGTLVRTYTYSDSCGNTATAEMYILLTDNDPPTLFGVPGDMEMHSGRRPPMALVSARDNSGELIEVISDEKTEGEWIIRTWSATDPCGNRTNATQRIRVKE